MRKLAIKIKVKNSIQVTRALHDSGRQFGEEYQQFDRIFVPRGFEQTYDDSLTVPQLIIRTNTIEDQISHLMILKRPVDKNLTYFFQTQVMDYNQTAHIVNNMGYELLTEVAKTRKKIVFGSIILYLDYIDGHGWFIKVEKNLKNNESISTNELWDLLQSFSLTNAEEVGRYSEIIKK